MIALSALERRHDEQWQALVPAMGTEGIGPRGYPGRALVNSQLVFNRSGKARVVTSRVFRAGEVPPDDEWAGTSVNERVEAVWTLTRQCIEWTHTGDEPRLQRSVSRVQRKAS